MQMVNLIYSCPAISCPAFSCLAFSRPAFSPLWILLVRHFDVLHFQSPRLKPVRVGDNLMDEGRLFQTMGPETCSSLYKFGIHLLVVSAEMVTPAVTIK